LTISLTYGSVCSGIEAATVAWHPLGWRAAFFSEIEPFPSAVLSERWPEVPLHGDFTTIDRGDYGTIDILVGGTPCQDFSVAGLRAGLAGPRGGLTIEFAHLAQRLRPRWLVWENVPGVLSIDDGKAFAAFLWLLAECGYGFAYRILDAQYFGVPQRRRRVFVVGHFGNWRRAAAVLFESESLRLDSPPRRETGQATAGTISASLERCSADEGDRDTLIAFSSKDHGADASDISPTLRACGHTNSHANAGAPPAIIGFHPTLRQPEFGNYEDCAPTLRGEASAVAFGGNNTAGAIDVATAVNAHGGPHGRLDFESETFVTHALRGEGFDASEDGTGRGTPIISSTLRANSGRNQIEQTYLPNPSGVRRLMPRECERLQGFPDDYTLIPLRNSNGKPNGKWSKDGPRYKAIGNSMATPVMAWIGKRIAAVEAMR
jgi:DNA (cytosine-5)-methyltransferase 1